MTWANEPFTPEQLDEQTHLASGTQAQNSINERLIGTLHHIYEQREEDAVHIKHVWERLRAQDVSGQPDPSLPVIRVLPVKHIRSKDRWQVWSFSVLVAVVVIGLLAGGLVAMIGRVQHSQQPGAISQGTQAATSPQTPVVIQLPARDRYVYATVKSMCGASMVADVVAGSTGPGFWNTVDGAQPAGLSGETVNSGQYSIYTPIHFSQMHVLLKHVSSTDYVVMGGTVGSVRIVTTEFPQLTPGTRYLVVFSRIDDRGANHAKQSLLLVWDAYQITVQGVVEIQPQTSEPGSGGQQVVTPSLAQVEHTLASC